LTKEKTVKSGRFEKTVKSATRTVKSAPLRSKKVRGGSPSDNVRLSPGIFDKLLAKANNNNRPTTPPEGGAPAASGGTAGGAAHPSLRIVPHPQEEPELEKEEPVLTSATTEKQQWAKPKCTVSKDGMSVSVELSVPVDKGEEGRDDEEESVLKFPSMSLDSDHRDDVSDQISVVTNDLMLQAQQLLNENPTGGE